MSADDGNTLTIEASEFQRLQTQLIELRTTNYQLKEEHQKLVSEIDQLKDEVQTKGKDLEKANKVSVFPCHLPCVNPVGEYVHVHVYVHSHITHVQNSLHNAVSVVTECVII
jgi:predicted nuclease with TOPRIM domain